MIVDFIFINQQFYACCFLNHIRLKVTVFECNFSLFLYSFYFSFIYISICKYLHVSFGWMGFVLIQLSMFQCSIQMVQKWQWNSGRWRIPIRFRFFTLLSFILRNNLIKKLFVIRVNALLFKPDQIHPNLSTNVKWTNNKSIQILKTLVAYKFRFEFKWIVQSFIFLMKIQKKPKKAL